MVEIRSSIRNQEVSQGEEVREGEEYRRQRWKMKKMRSMST
jgi:hypothetical protein